MTKKLEQDPEELLNLPEEARSQSFPSEIKSPIITLSSAKLNSDAMHTIVVGTINNMYSEKMFDNDLSECMISFNMEDVDKLHVLKIMPSATAMTVINRKLANQEVERIIKEIPPECTEVRIVRLGLADAQYLYDAIKHIVKEISKIAKKKIHFVTNGETSKIDVMDLCRSLVLSESCEELFYYNIDNYQPFGIFKDS